MIYLGLGDEKVFELLEHTCSDRAGPVIAPDQVAAILYTSGTTAVPKGVVHTHESLVETARAMRTMNLYEDEVHDCWLNAIATCELRQMQPFHDGAEAAVCS